MSNETNPDQKENSQKETTEQEIILDENATVTEKEAPNYDAELKAKNEKIAELEAALLIAKKNENEAMIRARAEIDNVRKRLEQDVEKARKFALEKITKDLLDVIDNLERALTTFDLNDEKQRPIIEGVELTLKSLLSTLNKFGVEVILSNGEILNPELHQAVTIVESAEHQQNQVVDTMQKGYTLHGRLLRPAMVVVAK